VSDTLARFEIANACQAQAHDIRRNDDVVALQEAVHDPQRHACRQDSERLKRQVARMARLPALRELGKIRTVVPRAAREPTTVAYPCRDNVTDLSPFRTQLVVKLLLSPLPQTAVLLRLTCWHVLLTGAAQTPPSLSARVRDITKVLTVLSQLRHTETHARVFYSCSFPPWPQMAQAGIRNFRTSGFS
jgi:hypothetical protein